MHPSLCEGDSNEHELEYRRDFFPQAVIHSTLSLLRIASIIRYITTSIAQGLATSSALDWMTDVALHVTF